MLEIKVPEMGESITEATIASWLKKEGESVEADEPVAELETDKATVEVLAPSPGTIQNIHKKEGDTVTVNEVIAQMGEGTAEGASEQESSSTPVEASASSSQAKQEDSSDEGIMPAARKLIEEHGLDPAQIQGTGKDGRILKEDVQNYLNQQKKAKKESSDDRAMVERKQMEMTPVQDSLPEKSRQEGERVVPMSRLRQTIAKRLVDVQQTAAILTTFNEIDMNEVMKLRGRYKEPFKEKYEIGLGFMSFFAKAVVQALKAFPAVNAEIQDNQIVYKDYYHLGVAVGGPKGLVVPVVRYADQLSFAQIEAEITRLAKAVQNSTISLDELQGGTFSITNGGIYGSMLSTPILNPPQSGILGMHNIVKRPVVVNDEIVIRPIMYVALSYDHRIVDGKEAVSFLVKVKEAIEDPSRLLLEV